MEDDGGMHPGFVCRVLLMLAMSFVQGCALQQPDVSAETPASVPLDYLPALAGDYFKLDSNAVGRPFHIYVRLPPDYDERPDTRYPVVYVLDGDSLFPILAANHLFLNFDEGLPEAIVVGIAYGSFEFPVNRRGYDYTPPDPGGDERRGGAPAFHTFLASELIPEVERRFRADSARRVLFGQSRGGQMVLYSAFTDPDLFWGRIASNPVLVPGRYRFFSPAAPAARDDLGLVVTSGERDRPAIREDVLAWFDVWEDRDDAPWAIRAATMEGATHSADSAASYRLGMLWLFDPSRE